MASVAVTVTHAVTKAGTVPHPVIMAAVAEPMTRAVQMTTGAVKGTLELAGRPV
ncbi:hypothetical protein AB1L88_17040 [Tautonia sp. JC769]|uniref:hypothetical protein n=1 Tax=Tautonia sp. JC769 TaxID=3232135 RepID=UPI00345960FD